MSSFDKLYKDNGILTEEGKNLLAPVEEALRKVFASPEVREMSISQLRTLGSSLSHLVGETTSNVIQGKTELTNRMEKLTDEQFEAYLKAKYGDKWMLVSLTPEEFARVRPLSRESIEKALEEGRKAAEDYYKNVPAVRIDPGLRFR
jgi:hypothetical protein